MGIVSIICFAFFFQLLVVVTLRLHKDKSFPLLAGGCLFFTLLSAVWMIDTYFYKFPNPLSGPKVENLKKKTPEPTKTPDHIELSAPERDITKDAQEEHEDHLRAWEINISK